MLSPMQAIQDYENKNGLPSDWINFAIRHASPNGHWQRLERGEIKMDAGFFKGFTQDLQSPDAWKVFNSSFATEKKQLKHLANPTQLGDHVSLKAEAADSNPTDEDKGAGQQEGQSGAAKQRPSLSKLAKDTTIGDPVSLESEDVVESSSGESPASAPPQPTPSASSKDKTIPPEINGEQLFWAMMSASRHPDPYVFPALTRLSNQKPRPIIAALSNTVTFPPDHPWSKPTKSSSSNDPAATFDPKTFFDVYVSSSEAGMRKPSREIYDLTLQRLNEHARKNNMGEIRAEEIVFLDDIGENLKTAREVGMRTIKVQLGKTWRAVKQLEAELGGGVELMDEKTRRSKL